MLVASFYVGLVIQDTQCMIHRFNSWRARKELSKRLVATPEIPMIDTSTHKSVYTSILNVATQIPFVANNSELIRTSVQHANLPMFNDSTMQKTYDTLYTIGLRHYARRSKSITKNAFIQNLVLSDDIPVTHESPTHIFDTLYDIVGTTIAVDISLKSLFVKLVNRAVDIPMINESTEYIVFEKLYDIAMLTSRKFIWKVILPHRRRESRMKRFGSMFKCINPRMSQDESQQNNRRSRH